MHLIALHILMDIFYCNNQMNQFEKQEFHVCRFQFAVQDKKNEKR